VNSEGTIRADGLPEKRQYCARESIHLCYDKEISFYIDCEFESFQMWRTWRRLVTRRRRHRMSLSSPFFRQRRNHRVGGQNQRADVRVASNRFSSPRFGCPCNGAPVAEFGVVDDETGQRIRGAGVAQNRPFSFSAPPAFATIPKESHAYSQLTPGEFHGSRFAA